MEKVKSPFKNRKFVITLVAAVSLAIAEVGIQISDTLQNAIATIILALAGGL